MSNSFLKFSSRRSLAAATALALVLPNFLLGSSASAASAVRLGIGSNLQFEDDTRMRADLASISRAGIRYTREDIYWNYVQPTSPDEWLWDRYDRVFTAAAEQGIQILPIIGYGTPWATGSDDMKVMPSTDTGRAAYGRYAAEVARRYGPNGAFWAAHPDLRARPVKAVDLWNEPWYPGPADPQQYIALIKAASRAVRALPERVKIVVNADQRVRGLARGGDANWSTSLFRAEPDLDDWVDVWSIHPYTRIERAVGNAGWLDSVLQVRMLRDELMRRGLGGEIWVTELGYSSFSQPVELNASETLARLNMVGAMRALLALGGTANPVTRIYAFTIARPDPTLTAESSVVNSYSLMRPDGSFTPALDAFCDSVDDLP